jgi:hypothetical protein
MLKILKWSENELQQKFKKNNKDQIEYWNLKHKLNNYGKVNKNNNCFQWNSKNKEVENNLKVIKVEKANNHNKKTKNPQ